MNILMITKNAQFHDPSQEVISGAGIGIVWNNSNYSAIGRVISPFEWTLTGNSTMREYLLRDSRGEVRPVDWGKYSQAIEYPSWEQYDCFRMKEELQKLKDELNRARDHIQRFRLESEGLEDEIKSLRNALTYIFDVNEEGGRGSRRRVRELILEQGILLCEDCGKASCLCHEDYDD